MANEAVLTSAPRMYTTQAGNSLCRCLGPPGVVALGMTPWELLGCALQGVVLSESKTPRSLASCSSVMGRKDASNNQQLATGPCFELRTHCANGKDFCGEAIAVPAILLFLTCWSRILLGVPQLILLLAVITHLGVGVAPRRVPLVICFNRRSRADQVVGMLRSCPGERRSRWDNWLISRDLQKQI
jgi:hypothetical protein